MEQPDRAALLQIRVIREIRGENSPRVLASYPLGGISSTPVGLEIAQKIDKEEILENVKILLDIGCGGGNLVF